MIQFTAVVTQRGCVFIENLVVSAARWWNADGGRQQVAVTLNCRRQHRLRKLDCRAAVRCRRWRWLTAHRGGLLMMIVSAIAWHLLIFLTSLPNFHCCNIHPLHGVEQSVARLYVSSPPYSLINNRASEWSATMTAILVMSWSWSTLLLTT